MPTYERIDYGSDDGAQLGGGATAKIGFYGATPIVQRSGSAQAAPTLTTATTSGFGFSAATAMDTFVAHVAEIRAALVALGLIKGSS